MDTSKTSTDKLGERLKAGSRTPEDLTLLDEFRRSFVPAYETVIEAIRDDLAIDSTGRPAKSTAAIVRKLKRETIRLSQIQDIAGCRIVVVDTAQQDELVSTIRALFGTVMIFDRRVSPSHGYRAVHLIPSIDGKCVEIQVRTHLQHRWAELSEILSDLLDPELKYGGGLPEARALLLSSAEIVEGLEEAETRQAEMNLLVTELKRLNAPEASSAVANAAKMQEKITTLRARWADMSEQVIRAIAKARTEKR